MVDERTVTDFRALCAEALNMLDAYDNGERVFWETWKGRARAALAQPEPEVVGPSDEELTQEWRRLTCAPVAVLGQPMLAFARAVLARWGHQPVPVPVNERLPGPEDCDAEGRCWWLHVGEDGVGDWFQRRPYPSTTSYTFFRMTHWLPATALPLPQGEVE